jgi:type VI secretion system secreted protein VgrG
VTGSTHHGKANAGRKYADPDNNKKVIKTRSGNSLKFLDDAGTIILNSNKGNGFVTIHGDGTIAINAPHKITLAAAEINLNGGIINVNAGKNQTGGAGIINVKADRTIGVKAMEENISIEAKSKAINISSKEKASITTQKMEIAASEELDMSGTLAKLSGGEVQINKG